MKHFLRAWALSLTISVSASARAPVFCENIVNGLKGQFISKVAKLVFALSQPKAYAGKEFSAYDGRLRFNVDPRDLGHGAFGIVFNVHAVGDPTLRSEAPDLFSEDGSFREDLSIKFPHKSYLPFANAVARRSIIDEAASEERIIETCRTHNIALHPSVRKKSIYASLDSKPVFLIKELATGKSLDKFGGAKNLSEAQRDALEKLFNSLVDLERESLRLTGKAILLDIKPDNLYWDGTDWQFYEISTTVTGSRFFVAGGFAAYLEIVNSFSKGVATAP